MRHWGGIVPEVASREHLKTLPWVVDEALASAGLKISDIDWIVATRLPGLIGSLLVGVSYGKALAYALKKPFTGMNHLEGHLYSPLMGALKGERVPPFPWLALVVSGGHSEFYYVESMTSYRWLGGTLDDAAGEAFDKVGKLLGMDYPAGPTIDKGVKEWGMEVRNRFAFPRAKVGRFEFSFSGLKTAVALEVKKEELSEGRKWAIAASAQEAILDALVMKFQEAAKEFPNANWVVAGGVACNSRLRELLPNAFFPAPRYCSDNAAMIGHRAALLWKANALQIDPWNVTAEARGI